MRKQERKWEIMEAEKKLDKRKEYESKKREERSKGKGKTNIAVN